MQQKGESNAYLISICISLDSNQLPLEPGNAGSLEGIMQLFTTREEATGGASVGTSRKQNANNVHLEKTSHGVRTVSNSDNSSTATSYQCTCTNACVRGWLLRFMMFTILQTSKIYVRMQCADMVELNQESMAILRHHRLLLQMSTSKQPVTCYPK